MSIQTSSRSFQDETWDSIRKFSPETSVQEITSPSSSTSSVLSESLEESTSTSSFSSADNYGAYVQDDELPLVAVLGVGYVGLHLVTALSKLYKVIAFDINAKRLAKVAEQFQNNANIYFTYDASSLSPATHFLVAVPTPLLPGTTETDTSIIRSALDTIRSQARRGATVVIESSVSVGMTRSLLGKMVQEHGLHAGMSPEVRRQKFTSKVRN
jgi:threonine dehydrogenase-like Zn-dependent dehydrogenase